MVDKRVVLVTGIAGYWGGRVASALLAAPEYHVIGLDSEPPAEGLVGLDYIQADVRNPLLYELFRSEDVHTVCHLKFIENNHPSETAFDVNVMGTMKVFGACAEAGVRKLVFKSSTAVYGALPDNSAFLREDMPLRGSRKYGYTRDLVEIEAFCNGFRGQYPQINLTILRFPNIIGPGVESPLTQFLSDPLAPVLLGFDPMMQLIHEEDVVQAIVHSINNDVQGIYNVAAQGAMPLSKLMALAGKFPLPVFHMFAYWGMNLPGSGGLQLMRHVPIELDYIRYPWVGDLTRMKDEMMFEPVYTAEEALREFAGKMRVSHYEEESPALGYDGERLRDTIERRRRNRERLAAKPTEKMEGDDHE